MASATETWGSTDTDGITATNRVSSYTYDTTGRFKLSETNPLGHTQTYTYDALLGVPLTTTGPNGLTTSYTYDDLWRTASEVRADGTQTRSVRYICRDWFTAHCPQGAVSFTVVVTDGAPTTVAYQDLLMRQLRAVTGSLDGRGSIVDTQYDALGRVSRKSEPYYDGDTVYWTNVTYDILGRPLLSTRPDTSTQSVAYAGRTVTKTNELGQTEVATVDALGRQISVTDAQGNVTAYAYDAGGQPTSVTDASSNITTMTYDIRGNKIAMSDPDMAAWSYRYNALGMLVDQTDAKGIVTQMTYDELGRMLTRVDDVTGVSPQTATWEYDLAASGVGKLYRSYNAGYEAETSYDVFGRPSSVTETIDGTAYTVTTTYDAYSRPDTLTYPSGFAARNVYTSDGHLDEVQYASSGIMLWEALAMDARGNITGFKLGNGAESTRAHDPESGRIASIYSTHNGSIVQDLAYAFDAAGNLTRRTDSRQGYVETAVYDDLNRVTRVDTATGVHPADTGLYLPASMWSGTSTSIAVSYDVLGNITSKTDIGTYGYADTLSSCTGVTGAVSSAGPRAVSSIAGTINADYCYDANGNLLSGNLRTVSWTAFGKPGQISRAANTVSLSYGPDRGRYKRIDTTATSTTLTHYIGGKLYEAIDRDGVLEQKHYVGGFAVITTAVATSISQAHYLLTDHLGSVDTIMEASGAVIERMSFDPWGKRRQVHWVPISDPAGHQPLVTTRGYTGHEQLDNVGLVHMNGRVYDPEIGRFLSADPYVQHPFNGQSLNRYSYGLNNPLSYTDPTGFYLSNDDGTVAEFANGKTSSRASEPQNRGSPSGNYTGSSSSSSSNSGSGGCGCGSRGSGSFIFDPTPIARQNLGLSGGIRAGSPVASTPVQTTSYLGPTRLSVPGHDSSQFGYGGSGYDSSQFEYGGSGYEGQVASYTPAPGYWGAGPIGPVDLGNRFATNFVNSSSSILNSILNPVVNLGASIAPYAPYLDMMDYAIATNAPGYGKLVAVPFAAASIGSRSAARVSRLSADNIATVSPLRQQLQVQSANSPFLPSGKLTSGAIAQSDLIVDSTRIGNKAVPTGYGKYATQTFQSPAGNFKVHFYRSDTTGDVYYGLDYKAKFNN